MSVEVTRESGRLVTSALNSDSSFNSVLFAFIIIKALNIVLYQLDYRHSLKLVRNNSSAIRQHAVNSYVFSGSTRKNEQGAFLSFVNNSVPKIAENYIKGTVDIIKCSIIILTAALTLISIHWLMAILIVGCSLAIIIIPRCKKNEGIVGGKRYAEKLSSYNTLLTSAMEGLSLIRSYSYKKILIKLDSFNSNIKEAQRVLDNSRTRLSLVITAIQTIKTAGVLILGVWLIRRNQITIGDLITSLEVSDLVGAPIEVLSMLIHSRHEVEPLVSQYESFCTKNSYIGTKKVGIINTISLSDVSCNTASYPILVDCNAVFVAGEKNLISGESGSGKTTLLSILSGNNDLPYSGKVFINGIDINMVDIEDFKTRISVVFQDPVVFHDSLKENILFGIDCSEKEYYDLLKKCNLLYLEKRYQDEKLSVEIIDNFSRGEKQRIAIARALARKPEMIILDEPIASLDEENAALINDIVLSTKSLVIYVSHNIPPNETRFQKKYSIIEGTLVMQ